MHSVAVHAYKIKKWRKRDCYLTYLSNFFLLPAISGSSRFIYIEELQFLLRFREPSAQAQALLPHESASDYNLRLILGSFLVTWREKYIKNTYF